jgi:Fe-S cluster assembly protein SufD
VIASHGATVGQLDEEALLYLRSRGLSRDEARNLLTMAFCRSVTDQLPVEALREPLGDRLTRSLT